MRRAIALLGAAALLAGCSSFKRTFGISESPNPHHEPSTTSIYGDWVLASPVDSTAFAGASLVELQLQPSDFTLTATYPGQAPVVVRGTVSKADDGTVTLVPTTSLGAAGRYLALSAGKPISLYASAAGGTLVFAPPTRDLPMPSSVWNQRAAAQAAGKIPATKRDSTGH